MMWKQLRRVYLLLLATCDFVVSFSTEKISQLNSQVVSIHEPVQGSRVALPIFLNIELKFSNMPPLIVQSVTPQEWLFCADVRTAHTYAEFSYPQCSSILDPLPGLSMPSEQWHNISVYLQAGVHGPIYSEQSVTVFAVSKLHARLHGNPISDGDCSPTHSTYYEQMREDLLASCGEICDTSIVGTSPLREAESKTSLTKLMTGHSKDISCDALWMSPRETEGPFEWPPPVAPPCSFFHDFTMGPPDEEAGRRPLQQYYLEDIKIPKSALGDIWTRELIDSLVGNIVANASRKEEKIPYGDHVPHLLLQAAQEVRGNGGEDNGVNGKRVLVIGSMTPWIEATFLAAGARSVVTLEYRAIDARHPQMEVLTYSEIRSKFLEGSLEHFDIVVTFSSVEHSGLGRYGDAFNPWGDLMTVARAWCVTKPGGILIIGIPFEQDLGETIVYNAHRIYGPKRYRHLVANFNFRWAAPLTGFSADGQRIFAFDKRESPKNQSCTHKK